MKSIKYRYISHLSALRKAFTYKGYKIQVYHIKAIEFITIQFKRCEYIYGCG